MKYFLYMDVYEKTKNHYGPVSYKFEDAILCDGIKDSFGGLTMVATENEDTIHLEYYYVIKTKGDNAEKVYGNLDVNLGDCISLDFKCYDFFNKQTCDYHYNFYVFKLDNKEAIDAFLGHHCIEDKIRYYEYVGNTKAVEAYKKDLIMHSGPPIAPIGSGMDPDVMKDYIEEELKKRLK